MARPGSRFAGRRLSPARLALSVVGVLAVGGALVGASMLPAMQAGVPGDASAGQWFASYYDVTLETGGQLARSPLGTSTGGAVLAFVVAQADDVCTPTWGKAYSLDDAAKTFELDRRVERMRREGEPLAASFGGSANTELAGACTTVPELTAAYRTVMDRYTLDVMDVDIEGDMLANVAATERRAQAVASLQNERRMNGGSLDVWLTLPVAPSGLTPAGLAQVESMLSAGVTLAGVNLMTMDYGTDGTIAMSSLSIDALQSTAVQIQDLWRAHGLALPDGGVWSLIGATPMIGVNDVKGEVFTLDDAAALNAFAVEKGVARLSMWSLTRDQTCGSNYPTLHIVSTACSGIEQAGVSFATVLAEGFTGTPSARPVTVSDGDVIEDDPATSPYPVWSSQTYYSEGVTVVWHGSVYVSKWWNEDGSVPDDPRIDTAGSAWTYIGPVLPGDVPFALPQLAPGTYPEWSSTALYDQGDRVMLDGSGYEARWWSQGKSPARSVLDHDYSPWKLITGP
ncbi:hypothetical protein B7R54_11070 [Subtercola boreus]|uniref:Chitin-binding type-3 domain-containing protein n=1 Tax=Subtercola boreus TaxID=120213 RepID=A0A3E0VJQ5_9MICO|nr:carbohydrate-binding protein [Subtercola boreus]RFA09693.1 hypothetical protein B7R54_11070 [Subtercola boreus]TQL53215.1 chitinase (glycosyl hydrolase family 18) [Subtercola boreus]